MVGKPQAGVLILTIVLMVSAITVGTGSVAAAAEPSITVSDSPDTVGPNETFEIEYTIKNNGADPGSFSLDVPSSSGITVEDISGDIQSSDTDVEPATASMDAVVSNGGTISVSITYNASDAPPGDVTLDLTARQPLDSTADSVSPTVTVSENAAIPKISGTDGADTVRQSGSYEREFMITNTGTNDGAFTLAFEDPNPAIATTDIGGEVESSDVTATPPSATTANVNTSDTVRITVNYSVGSDAELGTYTLFTLTAEQPVDNTTDSLQENVTVKQPAPEDPQERASEIAEKDDPAELSQNDVTAAITRFNRGQTVNGINIEQNDITTLITLFERR